MTLKVGNVYDVITNYKGKPYRAVIQLEPYRRPNWDFNTRKSNRFQIKVLSGNWPYTTISENNFKGIQFKRLKTAEMLYNR